MRCLKSGEKVSERTEVFVTVMCVCHDKMTAYVCVTHSSQFIELFEVKACFNVFIFVPLIECVY